MWNAFHNTKQLTNKSFLSETKRRRCGKYMWTGGMTFADSIIISLVGLLVVFSALAVLAIAVIIISKVIGTLFKESAPKAAAAVAAPAPAIDEESYAVLLAAVSEEARLSGEQFRVTSIKEL